MADITLKEKVALLRAAAGKNDFKAAYAASPVTLSFEEVEALSSLTSSEMNGLADSLEKLKNGIGEDAHFGNVGF